MARAKKESSERMTEDSAIQLPSEPVAEPIIETAVKATAAEPADDGIAELKKRLEAAESTAKTEQEARARAERERNEAVQRAYHAKNENDETSVRLIDNAHSQLVEQNKFHKREQAAAWAAGDFERAADLGEIISDNVHKLKDLVHGKIAYKERPKDQPPPLDPVEAFAAQCAPRAAAWIRSHPEYVTNPKLYQKMIAAHNLAVNSDIREGTDDYFSAVEDTLKIPSRATRAQVDPDGGDEETSPFSDAGTGRSRQSPAIPVSRDITPSGERIRVVRLSPDEIQMAKDCGLSPQEYWKNKEELKREGKIH